MTAESMSGLEDLMMGNVSEGSEESPERVAQRLAAARAKMAKIKRDESSAKNFDQSLSELLPKLSATQLEFVIFLIDNEIPSLTILGMLSLTCNPAGKICYSEFSKYIAESANFAAAELPPKISERVSLWWTFIFAADHCSTTTKLRDKRTNKTFVHRISAEFSKMLKSFLVSEKVADFSESGLKKTLKKYADAAFHDDPLGQF